MSLSKIALSTKPVQCTKDYYPADKRKQLYIIDTCNKNAFNHAFQNYDSSVINTTEAYTAKGHDEIAKEMFQVVDGSGLKLCLRPELTPSLARMMAATKMHLPVGMYCPALCFRNGTTSKGRSREFLQFNFDVIGTNDITGEIRIFACMIDIAIDLGFTPNNFEIRYSDRYDSDHHGLII